MLDFLLSIDDGVWVSIILAGVFWAANKFLGLRLIATEKNNRL